MHMRKAKRSLTIHEKQQLFTFSCGMQSDDDYFKKKSLLFRKMCYVVKFHTENYSMINFLRVHKKVTPQRRVTNAPTSQEEDSFRYSCCNNSIMTMTLFFISFCSHVFKCSSRRLKILKFISISFIIQAILSVSAS